jgi:Domain of unknown function (DUF6815)
MNSIAASSRSPRYTQQELLPNIVFSTPHMSRPLRSRAHASCTGPMLPPFRHCERGWKPSGRRRTLGIDTASLPIIWDADFLYGARTAAGEDTYVLCEINVSCVFGIPDEAPAAIARLALKRCSAEV